MSPADLPLSVRKRVAVDESSGCWLWTAGFAGKGYAYGWFRGGMSYMHRVTYHLLVDDTLPIRGGGHAHCIDHLCPNKSCINPEHLELVEWAENLRRWHRQNPGGVRGYRRVAA